MLEMNIFNVYFKADALGALVDPTKYNTSIEQENLTPKQPGYYIQKRKEEEEARRKGLFPFYVLFPSFL